MVSRIINILWHLPQKEAIDSWPATGYYQMHLFHLLQQWEWTPAQSLTNKSKGAKGNIV